MIFDHLLSALDRGNRVDVVTIIDSHSDCYLGKMMMIHQDGRVEAQFDDFLADRILDKLTSLVWTKPVTISIVDSSGGTYRIFWDKTAKKRDAIVFGGGHISQPLVQMLSLLDFSVTIVDDRPQFANKDRFPSAQKVICDSFQQSFSQVSISDDTAVIIVTRGHRYDMECLRATMCSKARYLGMIGSKKRIRDVQNVLRAEGAPEELGQRLKAPIGLDINSETPAEIAVSIVAEVIAVYRGSSSSQSLSKHKEA